jgi:hypothetical protein
MQIISFLNYFDKKSRCTTVAIRIADESADMSVFTLNKLTAIRKVKCYRYSYLDTHNA